MGHFTKLIPPILIISKLWFSNQLKGGKNVGIALSSRFENEYACSFSYKAIYHIY